MELFEGIEETIEKGYSAIAKDDYTNGCDLWLEAWEELKALMEEDGLANIQEIDDKYPWREFISNYVQDLEIELGNAGIADKTYFSKRITYCRELCERCGNERLMRENTRRAIARSYFELGSHEQSVQEFEAMLQEDPNFGWAYIEWADCYAWDQEEPRYDKAYEILNRALGQSGLRDRKDVLERAVNYSEECGDGEKTKYYKRELRQSSSARVEKVGRNEPCPCGSGKKYKKCCGV
jgi:tetratricopeptide (TPR) repeat protein